MDADRERIEIAGLTLYPLPGNPVLEYDGPDGRWVMLLAKDLNEIAALQASWRKSSLALPGSKRQAAITLIEMRRKRPSTYTQDGYVLGWDFDRSEPVIRLMSGPD